VILIALIDANLNTPPTLTPSRHKCIIEYFFFSEKISSTLSDCDKNHFTMNSATGEIGENVRVAREYSLLGNYETALIYYQGVVQQIHRHLQTIVDQNLKEKWQEVSLVQSLEDTKSQISSRLICF